MAKTKSELARMLLDAIDADRGSFVSPAIRRVLETEIAESRNAPSADEHSELARKLIDAERWRQDTKWGEQNHDPQAWMAILGEEFGELSQAANDLRWPKKAPDADPVGHAIEEAVHTAAVAKAIVECLLRGKWQWPRPPSKYDDKKLYAIRSDDGSEPCYLSAPWSEELKARVVRFAPMGDDTLIGSGESCEETVRLMSGVCAMAGCRIEEVPNA
jgi:hypothetical protein